MIKGVGVGEDHLDISCILEWGKKKKKEALLRARLGLHLEMIFSRLSWKCVFG